MTLPLICKRLAIALLLIAPVTGPAFAQGKFNIIPEPQLVTGGEGSFTFTGKTKIVADNGNKALMMAISPLRECLQRAAGMDLPVVTKLRKKDRGNPAVMVSLDPSIVSDEGYVLDVTPARIVIRARIAAGAFYAIQSLLQLLPPAIESREAVQGITWSAPSVHIEDAPRFAYRGIMLDVARHFMPLEFIRKLIDIEAMQKMNRLHLHLTDSQGWRFESFHYPKLMQIGAYRKGDPLHTTYDYASRPNDTLYGGYYTQAQLKELVQYAAARFVTIIPEIEMPSHSMSAIASYPFLACLDSAGKAYPYPQAIQNEYCTKDSVFIFLDTILSEVMRVFPSTYIHIGGDEADKSDWRVCPIDQKRMKDEGLKNVEELQSYFIRRIEKFVNSKGRQIIGWDEILEGGLAPNAAVMSWRGEEGGIAAAKAHHRVVMSPGDYCYLDHYQSDAPGEPVAFGGLTTLHQAYGYDPVPAALNADEARYIDGVQGNLWTEYIPGPSKAEYMIFPRAIALAEVGWSEKSRKDFPDFTRRLGSYLQRLDLLKVNYSRHIFELKSVTGRDAAGNITVAVEGAPGHPVHYTLDGSIPTESSPVYNSPIKVTKDTKLTAAVIENGMIMDRVTKQFILHKAVGKQITLATPPDPKYDRGGPSAWVNGVVGSDEQFNDDEWLGWNGVDFEGIIDFGRPETLHSLRLRFFHRPSSWIWAPTKVTLQTSDDGKHFYTVGETQVPVTGDSVTRTVLMDLHSGTSRYLKITAECVKNVPPGYPGAGGKAWLFVDEAIVE